MKSILIPAALLFSASASAQSAPIGCTPLGTVEGKAIVGGGLRRKTSPDETTRETKCVAGSTHVRRDEPKGVGPLSRFRQPKRKRGGGCSIRGNSRTRLSRRRGR